MTVSNITFRRYRASHDAVRANDIYCHAIETLTDDYYSREQRQVWADWGSDGERLSKLLSQGITIVAETPQTLAGFAQLFPLYQVNMLYVRPECGRQGIGSQLLTILESLATRLGQRSLTTRASRASRPVFERAGFVVDRREIATRNGIELEGFRMSKPLEPGRNRP
ncbi:GNAT family N-acetyltransferase [Marinobacteraceae bacterium S3BR75-40.1]